MGPVDALTIALSKEIEALGLYQKFAYEHPAAQEIFLFLAEEESKHKLLIEKRISELTR